MAKSCKGVAGQLEPEIKLGKLPNFTKAVRELIKQWARSDDMDDLESRLLAVFEGFSSVRFRVARALCEFREGLHQGGWLPLVYAAAEALDVDERTVRRWCVAYEKSQATPAPDSNVLERTEIDTRASKNLEVKRGTHQAMLANENLTIEEATEQATEREPLHRPPPPAIHPLTPLEQWVAEFRESIRRGLGKVPENRNLEVAIRGTAEELWIMGHRDPILIQPVEPTTDVSSRRREPEPMPEPQPEPMTLSDLEKAAFVQFVRTLESATEVSERA